MQKDQTTILSVLVGSRSHGLHNIDSDYDYRHVVVTPTSELLKLGTKYKSNSFLEGKEDQTMYEIGHFLHLATKCNPSVLEVFKAPMQPVAYTKAEIQRINIWGSKLIALFPYVWNPTGVFEAFRGYAHNQRKKMQDKTNKLNGRQPKFAVAYLRTLINLCDLLRTGTFSVEIKDESVKQDLLRIKSGDFTSGEVVDLADALLDEAEILRDQCTHEPNIDKVNKFLLEIRKEFWE